MAQTDPAGHRPHYRITPPDRRTPKAGKHICRGRRGLHQGEGGHRAKGEGGSRVFIPAWGSRPITDITALAVRSLIKKFKEDGKPYQAFNLLGYARRLFNWAIGQHVYGIESSPCDRLKPRDIIGEKRQRTRILSDEELRAAWQATEVLGYPYGPMFRLLILTGQRRSEVAEARWSEFDLTKKLWTIPADRMKAAAAHVVPLSDDALTVLNSLPRFESGDYLFSTTFGKKPVNSWTSG